ncbi:MAG: diguanylate cyclase [Methylophilaceae bacterium]|nr:diguanylate cyclase [Methylophilaceae bacterium]
MDNERIWIQIAAAVLMGIFFLLHHLASGTLQTGIYFFIPVALISWTGGLLWGIAFSLLATVMLIAVDFHHGVPISAYISLYLDTLGYLVMFLTVAFLSSRLSEARRLLQRISREDFLTGAMNRLGFYEVLNMEIRRQNRFGHPYTLAIISCDNFKQINDTLGHNEGDSLLIAVAKTLERNTRSTDFYARLGSDEFALLFPLILRNEATIILEKLKRKLEETMREHRWDVTFSIGAVAFDKSPTSVGHALDLVDSVVHEAKQSGKNGIRLASYPEMETQNGKTSAP